MHEPRALVVEDDTTTRLLIEGRLRAIGFAVTGVADGAAALRVLQTGTFALLVTDLMLGELDGVAVLQAARALEPELRVIVLTARATLASAIAAVNSGASAYILKPAPQGELERHAVAALARRPLLPAPVPPAPRRIADTAPTAPYNTNESLIVGPLQIEPRRYHALLAGRPLQLSSGEFALLAYLARHADEVLAVPTIAQAVLGYPCSPQEARELIKARIHKLRQKLEADPATPRLIHCVRGAGYVLSAARQR
jgi:DNA-binding response OmpR family regulator